MSQSTPKLLLLDPRWGQGDADARKAECQHELEAGGYRVVWKQMVTADVAFTSPTGRVGIEMKQISDLLESHRIGRLDDELFRLQRDFAVPCLLITEHLGSDADVPEVGGWSFCAIDNMLLGRQLRGVHIIHCGTRSIAERIMRLDQYLERLSKRQIIRPKARHFPSMGKLSERAEVIYSLLQRVGGVKNKAEISENLAARYSLAQIMQWTESEWRDAGFSRLMAKKVYTFLKEAG